MTTKERLYYDYDGSRITKKQFDKENHKNIDIYGHCYFENCYTEHGQDSYILISPTLFNKNNKLK